MTEADPTEHSNIYEALLHAQEGFGPIFKDANNPYFKSKYLSLPKLIEAVRPALTKHGIVIFSRYDVTEGRPYVVTTLYHASSGTFVDSTFVVADLSNPQKIGSAGTYGMRYNLTHLLGIAPDEDDDGNAASLPPAQYAPPVSTGQQRQAPTRTANSSFQPPAAF